MGASQVLLGQHFTVVLAPEEEDWKQKGWRREGKKPLFYDSNLMEKSVSFLWGGREAAWKSEETQLTKPPLS